MSGTTDDDPSGALDAGTVTSPEAQDAREQAQLAPSPQPAPADTPAPAPAPTPVSYQTATTYDRDQLMAQAQALVAARQAAQQSHVQSYDPTKEPQDTGDLTLPGGGAVPKGSALQDFGARLWASTLQTGAAAEGVVSAAARAMGANPSTVAWIESQKQQVIDNIQPTLDSLSDKGKLALQASILHPFGGKAPDGSDIPSISQAGWGRWWAGLAADAVPSVAMAILPGGIAVQVAKATAFGALDAGGAYNEMAKSIDSATPEELSKSPVYAHLIATGMSDGDARKELLGQVAPAMVAEHFASGTVGGAGFGSALAGKLVPKGLSLIGRAAVGAVEGGATMGGQAAADDAITQQFQGQTQGKAFDPTQTALAAASGGIGGAVFGASGGVLHGGGHTDASAVPDPVVPDPAKAATATPDPATAATTPTPDPATAAPATVPTVSPEIEAAMKDTLPQPPAPAAAPAPAAIQRPNDPVAAAGAATPTVVAASTPGAPPTSVADIQAKISPVTPPETTVAPAVQRIVDKVAARKAAAPAPPANLAEVQARVNPPPPAAAEPTPPPVSEVAAPTPPGDVEPPAVHASPEALGVGDASPRSDPAPAAVLGTAEAGGEARPPQADPGVGPATPAAAEDVAQAAPPEIPAAAPVEAPKKPGDILRERLAAKKAADAAAAAPAPEAPAEPVSKAVVATEAAKPEPPKTAADIARARRAANKAAMAATGPAIRGEAHVGTGEAPEPASVETPEIPATTVGTRADGMTDLRDTMASQGPKIIKVRGGNDVAKVISGAMREIGELVDQKDNTRGAVTDAIEKWATDKAKPTTIPGTETKRAEVADQLMRLMTGKGVGEARREAMAQEARQEAMSQGSVHETEGAARRADIEDAHARAVDQGTVEHVDGAPEALTETSQGVQDFGGEKERAASVTDRLTKANDHFQKMMEGRASASDIAREFDWTPSAKGGRPPREELASFAGYLDKRIAEAERLRNDPVERKKLLDKLMATQEDDGLDRDLQKQMRATSPEYIAQMKEARAELADPVRAAVKRETKPPAAREPTIAKPPKNAEEVRAQVRASKAKPMPPMEANASRFVRASSDPVMNDAIERRLSQGPSTSHEILDMIANHTSAGDDFEPARALARRLREIAPNIPFYSDDDAVDRGLAKPSSASGKFGYFGQTLHFGRVVEGSDHIVLNLSRPQPTLRGEGVNMGRATVALHEVIHSVAKDYISSLAGKPENREYQALKLIAKELLGHMESGALKDTPAAESLVRYATMGNATNWLNETHAIMMTDPRVQDFAKQAAVSDEFRQQMTKLGFNPGTQDRSLWRHFTDWTRRALGLDPANSASGAMLLDHMMSVGTDITDRAVRARKGASADPVVEQMGSSLATATSMGDRTKGVLRGAVRGADIASMPDKIRRGLLQGADTDSIVAWNKSMFEPSDRLDIGGNPLVAFRAAQESIAAVQRRIFGSQADQVNNLAQRLQGRDELAQLMNDATIANVKLGTSDAGANAHVKDPDALAALQARYAKLSEPDQKTYNDTRDHYAAVYEAEKKSQYGALIRQAMPDVAPSQLDALQKVIRSKSALDKFLADPDNSALATSFKDEWQGNRQIVRALAKMAQVGFVQGDYFPLRRYGDYTVAYGDRNEPESYGMERFERMADAQDRRTELLRQGVQDVTDVQDARTNKLHLPSESPIADELRNAIRGKFDSATQEKINDAMQQIVLEHASRSAIARTRARRKGIAGASTEAARTIASEFMTHGVRMGYWEHGADQATALANMRLVSDDLGRHKTDGSQRAAQAVVNELEQRVAAQVQPGGAVAAIARKASGLGFIQSLMSPSHMITSSIEAHTNSAALLGARHGYGAATSTLARALADVSPRLLKSGFQSSMKAMGKGLTQADWDLSKAARDRFVQTGANAGHMDALFKGLDDAGLVDHSADRDLRALAQPSIASTTVGRYWGKFLDLNAAGSHAVDVANRSAIAKAAFDLELAKSGSVPVAVDRAVDMLRQAVPNYNLGNKARIATNKGALGNFAGPLMQFKQYGIHQYGVMANLVRSSLQGADAATRSEARKAFAGVLVTHAMMAGSLTLIADPLRLIGGLYDWITGAQGPHDYQNDVRGFMSDTFGPELGEVISRGLPHALGIDIHSRVGLANLLELPDLDSFDSKGLIKAMGTMAMGAGVQDAATMMQGISKVLHGDVPGGVQDFVPRVFRDPMKAMALADHGVSGPHGTPGLPASAISTGAALAQAVGFQPAEVTEYREGREAVHEAMQEAKQQRESLVQAWTAAQGDDRAAVMSQVRQFNLAHPGEAISMQQLVQSLTQRAKAAQQPGSFGLRLPPKGAALLAQAGRFANVGTMQ